MKKALVIEDNDNNMELITFLLQKSGYEYICASTGSQGYNMALQESPDFIILDIQLPDTEGTEVIKQIRASSIGDTIPVIAMTSYAMLGDKERLLEAGCNGYIEKPIDPVNVIKQIEDIVGI